MNEARESTRHASRQDVYAAIDSERDYQDKRWNAATTTSKGLHSQTEWIAYMEDYLREAKHLLARTPKQDARDGVNHIMRKVLAMGVCCMEEHGAPNREAS